VAGVSVEKDLSMTLSQKNALDKFRQRVAPLLTKPHMQHDIYLIRWLRARNFDINAAELMLNQNLRWRRDRKIDGILQENWTAFGKDFHVTVDTYDKEGRPVGVIDIYDWDIRAAVLQGKGQRLLRYLDFLLENITMQVFDRQAQGMNVTQWKVIGNADSFNLISHGCPLCIPLWIQFVQGLENHYPGWLDELIIIDAPSTISVILEAIRPFLSRQTRDALKIFSANRSKWMPYLDERISREERRQQYGGTKPPAEY
jgi:hypothetical protein